MSKLTQVCGRTKTFKIEEIEIVFSSAFLNIDDLPLLMRLSVEKGDDGKPVKLNAEENVERAKLLAELIPRILKKALPDATEEEVKEFALRNLKELTDAILEMSGLQNASD